MILFGSPVTQTQAVGYSIALSGLVFFKTAPVRLSPCLPAVSYLIAETDLSSFVL